MIGLLWFVLAVLVSPFISNARLQAENAALRQPWDSAPGYLIRDRDRVFASVVFQRMRAMGIRDKPIAPRSPWQNGYAERLATIMERELTDRFTKTRLCIVRFNASAP